MKIEKVYTTNRGMYVVYDMYGNVYHWTLNRTRHGCIDFFRLIKDDYDKAWSDWRKDGYYTKKVTATIKPIN